MFKGLIGRKVGMTQVFDDEGVAFPVTLIEAGPCYVTQVKTAEKDGYDSVQIGFDEVNPKRLTTTRPRSCTFRDGTASSPGRCYINPRFACVVTSSCDGSARARPSRRKQRRKAARTPSTRSAHGDGCSVKPSMTASFGRMSTRRWLH